jgi:outer membrane receptor protein involved in Fe transport
VRARGTFYRAFRAPTLNELYREFRVGNTVTRANDQLTPETVTGVEVGFDFTGESTRGGITLYRNSLGDLITNVTLPPQPPLIIRQRQNAAEALARGIEADLRQTWRNLRFELGYLFADSRFSNGKRIPQTPRHHGSAQLTWARGGTVVSGGLRAFSLQFEDELNSFLLPGFATLQLVASQRLSESLSLFGAIENVLDRQYVVGFSPTPLIGAPILWRIGMRWDGRLR